SPARIDSTIRTFSSGGNTGGLTMIDQTPSQGRTRKKQALPQSLTRDTFMNLVAQVMTTEPYASARRVFWVVDNGSSHRGKRAIDRLTKAFPNAVMVHTPVHASWTNQIEIFFSIVQRKVVQPNDFTDLAQVRDRLRRFEDRYNATAQPFQWKFTTSDLNDLLARLDRHTSADRQEESSIALAT
ncbi:transposase, partial [Streptomyces sp. BE303]|uniref:transposase n=1 Tax=Streptomyces sp. BE303 TaxID=3002528 RepID=UPI002E7A02C5